VPGVVHDRPRRYDTHAEPIEDRYHSGDSEAVERLTRRVLWGRTKPRTFYADAVAHLDRGAGQRDPYINLVIPVQTRPDFGRDAWYEEGTEFTIDKAEQLAKALTKLVKKARKG